VCFLCLFPTTPCILLRLIVRSGRDVSTFATRRLHACHHAGAPSGGRWNCGRELSGTFCLNSDLHVTFRDLFHAVKLRHVTDGFTSPPKEGVLRIFLALKFRLHSFLSGCTRRSLAESDDTRGCICTICIVDLLMMSGLRSKHVEKFNFM